MSEEILKDQTPGSTPLTAEDMEGLKMPHITTKGELNRVEQENITEAESKYFSKPLGLGEILTWDFLRSLHKDMLKHVWTWAGDQRIRETSVGIDPAYIMTELPTLLDNIRYWIENKTFSNDEIAARLHHGLVKIHLFHNGNGRHARLTADLVLINLEEDRFSWGSGDLYKENEVRKKYIESLQLADKHDFSELIEFVRS